MFFPNTVIYSEYSTSGDEILQQAETKEEHGLKYIIKLLEDTFKKVRSIREEVEAKYPLQKVYLNDGKI